MNANISVFVNCAEVVILCYYIIYMTVPLTAKSRYFWEKNSIIDVLLSSKYTSKISQTA